MILIYEDEGVSKLCVEALKDTLTKYNKKFIIIDSIFIIIKDLSPYRTIIIPGGADILYGKKLNGPGNQKIKNFVYNGGIYLGICAGAYYGCRHIDFTGEEYSIKDNRELAFFDGLAQGSLSELTNGYFFSECSHSKSVVSIIFQEQEIQSYYQGGSFFEGALPHQILATYFNGKAAIINDSYGQGRYILSGVHFEVEDNIYQWHIENNIEKDKLDMDRELHIMRLLKNSNRIVIWDFLNSFI